MKMTGLRIFGDRLGDGWVISSIRIPIAFTTSYQPNQHSLHLTSFKHSLVKVVLEFFSSPILQLLTGVWIKVLYPPHRSGIVVR